MPSIQKAYAKDFELIYPLMQEFNNPLLDEADWRALFTPHWPAPQDHFGYYIEDDGRAVGFLGTIFSQRMINNRLYNFCNLSTWIVKEEYRGMSLMLLFEVLKLKDYTITNFTAYRVASILRKFGFTDLAVSVDVFLPLFNPAGLVSGIRLYSDPADLTSRLQGESQKIYQDHARLKGRYELLEKDSDQCLLVFDVVKRKRLPVARIQHISNPQFFAHQINRFAYSFCLKNRLSGIFVPGNLLKGNSAHPAMVIPQRQTQLYRSADLRAEDIDSLYSELQILGLQN